MDTIRHDNTAEYSRASTYKVGQLYVPQTHYLNNIEIRQKQLTYQLIL